MTERILLVEGDEVLGQVFRELLDREGYQISRAWTSTEALQRVRIDAIGTMIVDLDTVPTGDLLVNSLWTRCSLPRSVVFVSVQPPEVVERGLLALWSRQSGRPPSWIRKPFRNEDFLAVVRKTLDANDQEVANERGGGR